MREKDEKTLEDLQREKLEAEIQKIAAERQQLELPFTKRPAFWGAVATITVTAFGAIMLQFNGFFDAKTTQLENRRFELKRSIEQFTTVRDSLQRLINRLDVPVLDGVLEIKSGIVYPAKELKGMMTCARKLQLHGRNFGATAGHVIATDFVHTMTLQKSANQRLPVPAGTTGSQWYAPQDLEILEWSDSLVSCSLGLKLERQLVASYVRLQAKYSGVDIRTTAEFELHRSDGKSSNWERQTVSRFSED